MDRLRNQVIFKAFVLTRSQRLECNVISARQHVLKTRHGDVEYIDVGDGTPTIYFHGTGAGNDAALVLEQGLLRSNCRLIIPNRPGYYQTSLGQRGKVESSVEQASELLDHLGIERAVVVGTSGGGMSAGQFACCYPQRAIGLLLQCAQSHSWDSRTWLPEGLQSAWYLFQCHRILGPVLRWETRRRAKTGHRHPTSCLRHMSGSRYLEIMDDGEVVRQITELAAMTLKCTTRLDGVQNDWAVLVGDNGIKNDTIHCPTLIIHDPADPLVPFAHAEWAHKCIAQSKLLNVHAGGHLIWFGRDSTLVHTERVNFINSLLA